MNTKLLSGIYLEIAEAQSAEIFLAVLLKFAAENDFEYANVSTIQDLPGDDIATGQVYKLPNDYIESFFDRAEAKLDPVMQYIKSHSLPLVWGSDLYRTALERTLYSRMEAFGLANGIAVAVHLPNSQHIMIGLDRKPEISRAPNKLQKLLGEIQLFIVHAIEPAFEIFSPTLPHSLVTSNLTARELEVLKWTIDGKTAWEIGVILSISERTAVKHLQNASSKLLAVNKHQAALKALRLGLIS